MFGPVLRCYTVLYIFGGSCTLTEFRHVQNLLCIQFCVLLYWQRYCTALQQRGQPKFAVCYNYGVIWYLQDFFTDSPCCYQCKSKTV